MSTKKPSARKPIRFFLETLDVKHKNAVCKLGTAKAKCKETKTGNLLWPNIAKRGDHTQINQNFREDLYHWILHHSKVGNLKLQMIVFIYLLLATLFF